MMNKYAPHEFGKVVVLMGGESAERKISLITGNNILQALQKSGVNAIGLDVQSDLIPRLLELQPDRAFIALHGQGGEDGVIQGVLEYLKIPYTGSGVAASALTLDKAFTKWVWQSHDIPTLPFAIIESMEDAIDVMNEFGLPLCIKPVNDGSSIGVTKIVAPEQIPSAYQKALKFGGKVMIEPWIEGVEYTVGILGETALPVIEIQTPRDFYDFDAKYNENSTHYICPCNLTPEKEQELQNLALYAFFATGCRDWGRVDSIADQEGNFWLLEINTIPGMTDHSLVPKAAKTLGISFEQLVLQILSYTMGNRSAEAIGTHSELSYLEHSRPAG